MVTVALVVVALCGGFLHRRLIITLNVLKIVFETALDIFSVTGDTFPVDPGEGRSCDDQADDAPQE